MDGRETNIIFIIDKKTGRFQDVMLVDGQAGLEDFCRSIGADADEVKTIY